MKHTFVFLITLLAFSTVDSLQAGPPKGFVALFNGKNLDGWNAKPNGWAVVDGVLTRKPRSGYIWSKESFGDFVLCAEVKVSRGCNSGIFFRTDPKNAVQGGFEIQVFDTTGKTKLGKHDHGALYDALAPSANPAIQPNSRVFLAVIRNSVTTPLSGGPGSFTITPPIAVCITPKCAAKISLSPKRRKFVPIATN